MLGKLLKYEIPALGRRLMPLYIGWAATAVLLGLFVGPLEMKSDFMVVISGMLYTAAATAVLVMAVVLIIQRYSNSLLGDEAYFNQVLPVTASEHIASKCITAMIWVMVSIAAMIVTGILIALFSGNAIELIKAFFTHLPDILKVLTGQEVLVALEVIILLILSTTKSILAIYTAITIGHQSQKHSTLLSIGAYIGVMIFETTVARILFRLTPGLFFPQENVSDFHRLFLSASVIIIILGTIYFFFCKYFMEKKLNLN